MKARGDLNFILNKVAKDYYQVTVPINGKSANVFVANLTFEGVRGGPLSKQDLQTISHHLAQTHQEAKDYLIIGLKKSLLNGGSYEVMFLDPQTGQPTIENFPSAQLEDKNYKVTEDLALPSPLFKLAENATKETAKAPLAKTSERDKEKIKAMGDALREKARIEFEAKKEKRQEEARQTAEEIEAKKAQIARELFDNPVSKAIEDYKASTHNLTQSLDKQDAELKQIERQTREKKSSYSLELLNRIQSKKTKQWKAIEDLEKDIIGKLVDYDEQIPRIQAETDELLLTAFSNPQKKDSCLTQVTQFADDISAMEKVVQENLKNRASLIEEYKNFIEKEKSDLITINQLREQAKQQITEAEKKRAQLTELKKSVEKIKADILSHSHNPEKYTPQQIRDIQPLINEIDGAIGAIEKIDTNLADIAKTIEQLNNPNITKEDATKIHDANKQLIDNTEQSASLQVTIARTIKQKFKVMELQKNSTQDIDKILNEAKALKEQIHSWKEKKLLLDSDIETPERQLNFISITVNEIKTINDSSSVYIENALRTLKTSVNTGSSEPANSTVTSTREKLEKSKENLEEQITSAKAMLEIIKAEHAKAKIKVEINQAVKQKITEEEKINLAQKELYELVKKILVDQIPYWNDQRLSGGVEVMHGDKRVKVPTGIGKMINLIQGDPPPKRHSTLSIFWKTEPQIHSSPKNSHVTPKIIKERLQEFGNIATERLNDRNKLGRKDATLGIYAALKTIGTRTVDMSDTLDRAKSDLIISPAGKNMLNPNTLRNKR